MSTGGSGLSQVDEVADIHDHLLLAGLHTKPQLTYNRAKAFFKDFK